LPQLFQSIKYFQKKVSGAILRQIIFKYFLVYEQLLSTLN
jgi:hypothetical protein